MKEKERKEEGGRLLAIENFMRRKEDVIISAYQRNDVCL